MTTVLESRRGRVVARCASAVAVVCAAGHLALLVVHGSVSATAVAMVALAAGCLVCARHLWVSPAVAPWLALATMNVLMLAVHSATMGPHLHHREYATALPTPHPDALMTVLTACAISQIVCAATVLVWYRRAAAAQVIGWRR
jgi:hypothetical protein